MVRTSVWACCMCAMPHISTGRGIAPPTDKMLDNITIVKQQRWDALHSSEQSRSEQQSSEDELRVKCV